MLGGGKFFYLFSPTGEQRITFAPDERCQLIEIAHD
jgi:hypothetical protein